MDFTSNIALGFEVALSGANLWYCFVGVLLGTLVGVLPGVGPVATIALLLPLTFSLPATSALIMLAGIYYGAQYGGSTTAILVNLPGESSSAVTTLDGYQMARKGRAGAALTAAALSSFFAGTVATVIIAVSAIPLTQIAVKFGPAEYFSLMVLGLLASVALASGSVVKAIASISLGILIAAIGTDVYTGAPRFDFGFVELADGIDFVCVAVGLFGIAEILRNLEDEHQRPTVIHKVTGLLPTRADLIRIIKPTLRGTGIGSLLGILPGGGAMLSSFAAYAVEKKVSANKAEFGSGAIEGVAAPESANDAGSQTSFIPMLTLGIPSNPVMALMIGAMVIQGVVPGPNVINERPELFWGLIASMWIGNLLLVLLNLPLVGLWVKLLRVPYSVLFPAIVVFCSVGVFSIESSTFAVFLISASGLAGYLLLKLDCEPGPLVIGFVLGPMLEENMRRAMLISEGDPTTFLTRPISLGLLIVSALVLIVLALPSIAARREAVFVEKD